MDWNEDLEYDLSVEDDADRYFRGLDCDENEDDFLNDLYYNELDAGFYDKWEGDW